jgi:Protein of unknown function (DUF3168)
MPDSSLSLQKAIVAALTADAAVGTLIGDRIYDAPPRAVAFPYLTIGQTRVADWSTGTEAGAEHAVTLHVWSRERGRTQAYEIMEAVEAALHDAVLALEGHALVNLRFEFAEARRDPDGVTDHGIIRFRAVTEPIG